LHYFQNFGRGRADVNQITFKNWKEKLNENALNILAVLFLTAMNLAFAASKNTAQYSLLDPN
jgi:hypothetical protein